MAQGFLNMEAEGLDKEGEAPTCPRGLIHQPELHVPQTSLFRDSKGKLPPSCPTAGLSPRNSEIRALCP